MRGTAALYMGDGAGIAGKVCRSVGIQSISSVDKIIFRKKNTENQRGARTRTVRAPRLSFFVLTVYFFRFSLYSTSRTSANFVSLFLALSVGKYHERSFAMERYSIIRYPSFWYRATACAFSGSTSRRSRLAPSVSAKAKNAFASPFPRKAGRR